MEKWEYLKVVVAIDKLSSRNRGNIVLSANRQQYSGGQEPDVLDFLNTVGEDGWEMTGVISWGMAIEGATLFFKRRKP